MTQPANLELESVQGCNLCGATEQTLRFPDTRQTSLNGSQQWVAYRCTHPGYGVHPPIVTCANCGLVYTDPRPRFEFIKGSYEAVEDPLYLREREAREITFHHHLRALERYSGPGQGRRLLDVGAYIGVFVEVAAQAGWDALGIEPSIWAVQYAEQRHLNIRHGILEAHDFDRESFDALTMWDVIEHFSDPLVNLRVAHDLLRPGGWIAVHTMDLASPFARLMGKRWPWLMQMHLYYFTRHTLGAMLERAGFRVRSIRPQGRYLRLGYLTTRLRPYSPPLAEAVERVAALTGLDKLPLPVNFGDLITAFAWKP